MTVSMNIETITFLKELNSPFDIIYTIEPEGIVRHNVSIITLEKDRVYVKEGINDWFFTFDHPIKTYVEHEVFNKYLMKLVLQ